MKQGTLFWLWKPGLQQQCHAQHTSKVCSLSGPVIKILCDQPIWWKGYVIWSNTVAVLCIFYAFTKGLVLTRSGEELWSLEGKVGVLLNISWGSDKQNFLWSEWGFIAASSFCISNGPQIFSTVFLEGTMLMTVPIKQKSGPKSKAHYSIMINSAL